MDIITNPIGLSEEENNLLEEALVEAHESSKNIEDNLPVNSETILIEEASSRFSGASWFTKIGEQTVIVAGIGGIGSYLTFLLSRLRIANMILYDDDTVERTNLSGQLFSKENIGDSKVNAIANMITEYSDFYNYCCIPNKYTFGSKAGKIMMCGFDNMMARAQFYSNWKDYVDKLPEENRSDCLFIDGRLAAEEFQVFCIKGTDKYLMDKYEKEWLFPDKEAEATLCSYKQTSFCANMIASIMVNLFVNFIANMCDPLIEREIPFYTRYDASMMLLKTDMV